MITPPLTVLHGNAPDELAKLPAQCVHTCVTSPPYWGLRDYGIQPVPWPAIEFIPMAGLPALTIPAQESVLGLEKDPWSFVAHIVHVFRQVHRVLRDDGTLWLNFGDSYAVSGGGSAQSGLKALSDKFSPRKSPRKSHAYQDSETIYVKRSISGGLKPKDLIGIPWRVAFALQADGWYLRMDNIWSKPNPMPESVTDRPTKAHEYLFLFSKQPRYFYDAEAIKEGCSDNTHPRLPGNVNPPKGQAAYENGDARQRTKAGLLAYSQRKRAEAGSGIKNNSSFEEATAQMVTSRNKRSVWTVGTHPYSEAHFATFPPKLITPCILAGTSARGCCPQCGTGFVRLVQSEFTAHTGETDSLYEKGTTANRLAQLRQAARAEGKEYSNEKKTIGWKPSCTCPLTPSLTPAIVLDPFGGSGTTGQVALEHGRHAILIEANPNYLPLIQKRTSNLTPGLML